jgi:ribose transport system substrate-binding protein
MYSHSRLLGACLALVILATIVLSGCAQHGGEKYVLVTTNKQIGYWQTARAGLDDAARRIKVAVDFAGPDTYDPQAEVEAFRAAVRAKVSGIMVSPADPNLMKPEIEAALHAGIPVITIDADAPSSPRLTFVGTNNYQAGLLGGDAAAKALNGRGNVVVFTMPNQANLEERLEGYRTAFSKYPGIKIDRVVDIKGDPRIAFDTTQSIVDKKEKIDGFVCLEAQSGKEVAAVLTQNHVSDKKIVAMDTDPDTLDYVAKDVIAATIAQKPYTMGYFGLRLLDDLHHLPPATMTGSSDETRSELPAFVDTGVTLVDRTNVSLFRKK